MSAFDVYSFGVVSASTLYRLAGAFPSPNGYAEVADVRHMTGGEATNSSIVLSRLGLRVKLGGNWIGSDEAGSRTLELLEREGIDSSSLTRKAGFRTIEEAVIADPGTRTILGTYGRLQEGEPWATPAKHDMAGARAICLDPFMKDASLHVAEWGISTGLPVVTIDCRHEDPLLRRVSAVVVSSDYLGWQYENEDLVTTFGDYQAAVDGLVIFTFGEREIWFGRRGGERQCRPAVEVAAIDTSGAGDAFRAGVVFGLLQGWCDADIVDFSASLAACVCTRSPGVLGAPNLEQLSDFQSALDLGG